MWLGSRGREWSRAGLAWGDVEARPGASDQEGGCRGSALADQGLALWPWVAAGAGRAAAAHGAWVVATGV